MLEIVSNLCKFETISTDLIREDVYGWELDSCQKITFETCPHLVVGSPPLFKVLTNFLNQGNLRPT